MSLALAGKGSLELLAKLNPNGYSSYSWAVTEASGHSRKRPKTGLTSTLAYKEEYPFKPLPPPFDSRWMPGDPPQPVPQEFLTPQRPGPFAVIPTFEASNLHPQVQICLVVFFSNAFLSIALKTNKKVDF